MFLSRWSVRRPIAMSAFIIVLIMIGVSLYPKLSIDLLPNMEIPTVLVRCEYQGASPSEIEVEVIRRIEDAVSSLDGIRHITSVAMEDQAQIQLEFNMGTNVDVAATDIREALNRIREDLPEGLTVQPLLKTTTAAYGKTAGFAMQTTEREDSDLRGPFLLGAVSQRNTGSAMSTMIWFPSGYLLEDNIDTTVSGGNSQLLIGCVQYLSGDASAITVPGKTLGGGKLLVNTTEKAILSILMMVVLPLSILGAGIVVVRRRKRR